MSAGGLSSTDPQRRLIQNGVKVDVVADNGRRWIRVNTCVVRSFPMSALANSQNSVKNSRMLAEFREIDSYLTGSEDESDQSSNSGSPSHAQPEFDNSVLRMARSLLAAANANPVQWTNEVPRITLRLTRLDPSPVGSDSQETDPRIARTVQCLRTMNIDVELGERKSMDVPSILLQSPSSRPRFEPTVQINLDLSVLIALVSDLTHSPLPRSMEEAKARFIPPPQYREWKMQRLAGTERKGTTSPPALDSSTAKLSGELSKHTKALTHHIMQEMEKGLIQELHDRLSAISSELPSSPNSQVPETAAANRTCFPHVQFWTTEEARSRCLRIISKIGGVDETRRAHALLASGSSYEPAMKQVQEELYWRDSRYQQGFIPLIPIRLHASSEPPLLPPGQNVHTRALPGFFHTLSRTCREILAEESVPHPRSLPDDLVEDPTFFGECHGTGSGHTGEIQRATVVKANPRLTSHTVQTLLWGAELGWTTLTSNKSGVKAMLREMKAARASGKIGLDSPAPYGGNACEKAAIWIVDPRSLAEGMRSDVDVDSAM